jgi:hypothetical protein
VSGLVIGVLAQIEDEPLRGDVAPYVVLVFAGFAVAIAGHLMQSRPLILAGIAILALGSLLPFARWG